METPVTSDVQPNVHKLPYASSRPAAAASASATGQLVKPALWTDQERIRNISAAIRERVGGEVFLTTEQTAEVLHISVRTLQRIPRYRLERFPVDGSSGHRYAACDIAHYFVQRCKESAAAEEGLLAHHTA